MLQPRGYVVEGYDRVDPYHLLGAKPTEMVGAHPSPAGGLSSATVSQLDRHGAKPWHPDSPLFWFGAILAVTMGLIGASTAVRVGPFRAGVAAGKT